MDPFDISKFKKLFKIDDKNVTYPLYSISLLFLKYYYFHKSFEALFIL